MTRRTTPYTFSCEACGTGHEFKVSSLAPRKLRVGPCRKCKTVRRMLPPGGGAATAMTDRDRLVLDLTAAGKSTTEIKDLIGVNRQRVWQIRRRAFDKAKMAEKIKHIAA